MKTKIRFLFHTGKGPNIKNGKWRCFKAKSISAGIIAWTSVLAIIQLDFKALKYNFSHVEEWFPDKHGNFGGILPVGRRRTYNAHQALFKGECFSSTTRGDAKGTRFIPANELLHHPERWDYIEVECDNVQEVYDWCKSQVGRKYDYWGLFGFFSPINIQHSQWWYCSEIIARAANLAKRLGKLILKLYKRISPRRLASKLAKKYGEPVSLWAKKGKKNS